MAKQTASSLMLILSISVWVCVCGAWDQYTFINIEQLS